MYLQKYPILAVFGPSCQPGQLTSNRPFWLKQIYRDIEFILRGLPGRCEVRFLQWGSLPPHPFDKHFSTMYCILFRMRKVVSIDVPRNKFLAFIFARPILLIIFPLLCICIFVLQAWIDLLHGGLASVQLDKADRLPLRSDENTTARFQLVGFLLQPRLRGMLVQICGLFVKFCSCSLDIIWWSLIFSHLTKIEAC